MAIALKTNNQRDRIFEFLIFYSTIGILFPAFKTFTGIPIFWPGIILTIGYAILYKPNIFFKKTIYSAIFILIIFVIQQYDGTFSYLLSESGIVHLFFTYILPVILLELIIYYNNKDFTIRLGKFSLILLFFSLILHLIAETAFPGISRNLVGEASEFNYPKWAIPLSFGLFNALPVLIGLLFLKFKKNFLHYSVIVLSVLSFIITGYFIALIFMVSLIGISLMTRLGFKKNILFIFLLLVFILLTFFKFELIDIGSIIPNEAVNEKVEGIKSLAQNGTGGIGVNSRQEKYNISLDGFLENKWIGGGDAGGHSYWLDKLSKFGIIGTIPYFLFLLLIHKRSLRVFPTELHYIISNQIILIALVMILNPYEYLEFFTFIFVYFPIISVYLFEPKRDSRKFDPAQKKLNSV